MAFFQTPPELGNQFDEDRTLKSFLDRHVPADVRSAIEPSLREMGGRAAGDLRALDLVHRTDEPKLVSWDPWGKRIDHIEVNPAWKEYARVAASEGLVARGYQREHGSLSRLHQFALVYLFHPSTQMYTCPLAMTDGCARTLEMLGSDELKRDVLSHLTSRDPDQMWTSGQWMTERTGGSDVGLSETIAREEDGVWKLYGTKWFTSAVTSQVALTLARPEGNGPGGKGLALFFLHVRNRDGTLNGMSVNRLKEKLGTKNLPTAELTLDGTVAEPVAGLRDGIRNMGTMLNITRTWNAVCAIATMRRGLALARDFARKRVAFGAPLSDKPLHVDTLASISAEFEAAFHLTFHEVLALGRDELGELSEEERGVLRVLQPLTKLTTGKQAVAVTSEVLECFGGAGYVEDTGLPVLLRDVQVTSIWEGTTNVLSLETFRTMVREEAFEPLLASLVRHAEVGKSGSLPELGKQAVAAAKHALSWAQQTGPGDRDAFEAGARRFALTLGRAYALSLLVDHAQWCLDAAGDARTAAAAARFARNGIDQIDEAERVASAERALALGESLAS